MINSPRTLESCRRLGIDLSELDPVTEDYIRTRIMDRERKKNIPKALIELRM